jgi:hypothetical protein
MEAAMSDDIWREIRWATARPRIEIRIYDGVMRVSCMDGIGHHYEKPLPQIEARPRRVIAHMVYSVERRASGRALPGATKPD